MSKYKNSVDNTLYDALAHTWWDPGSLLGSLANMNKYRFGYFERQAGPCAGRLFLDLGCGGGLITEEIAKRSGTAVGLDMSLPSLSIAERHKAGLNAFYLRADARRLPFKNSSFDFIVCADVLEHIDGLDILSAEISRVLKKDGLFLFNTINRNFLTALLFIILPQRVFKKMPINLHTYDNFIKPRELAGIMRNAGFELRDIRGLNPSLFSFIKGGLRLIFKNIPGIIKYSESRRLMPFHYMGCFINYKIVESQESGVEGRKP